jgi:hypothetical protein
MAINKKPMTENEKKAKMAVLKDAHSTASGMMRDAMSGYKNSDSPQLKSHVKDMSKDSGIDFKNDSDKIVDPRHEGDVVGRHISDENDDVEPNSEMSVYDINAELERLQRIRDGKKR